MRLVEASLTPLYQQVMDSIKDDVDSGKYQTGQRIPSEGELSQIYSVSRITVRRAVSELVDRGYLTKMRGKGTFVSRPKLERKICQTSEVQSFSDTCAEGNRVPGAKVLGVELVEAHASVAAFLGLAEGERLVHVRRLRTADGVPIMIENNYYPLREFAFLLCADLEDKSIFKFVEQESGRRPEGDERCTLEIVHAGSREAADLGVTMGEPLFLETVFFTDQEGKPFFVGKQRIVGSLYVFDI
ncbi:GntR family transcriptional regulator [Parafannyhessea umbonata]|uniref:Transcriptional regulator, GntR family n=2 Tax=Parafannyhessea umbonata TaxID=604330 RepID=A0A1H9PF82_9ACTN|nr:GntR family transcriptional regulator [Parafannyhessea umbonata]SER46797.1 transcriptional regulator, GntR family [Parafannyhessea umbonata]